MVNLLSLSSAQYAFWLLGTSTTQCIMKQSLHFATLNSCCCSGYYHIHHYPIQSNSQTNKPHPQPLELNSFNKFAQFDLVDSWQRKVGSSEKQPNHLKPGPLSIQNQLILNILLLRGRVQYALLHWVER